MLLLFKAIHLPKIVINGATNRNTRSTIGLPTGPNAPYVRRSSTFSSSSPLNDDGDDATGEVAVALPNNDRTNDDINDDDDDPAAMGDPTVLKLVDPGNGPLDDPTS
jgi:hypothetical protein